MKVTRVPGESTRGSALVLSLVATAIVLVLSASFTQFASAVANRQAQAVNKKRAFYMAEAGLSEAFAGFTCGKSGNVGTAELPAKFGEGLFWVEATELDSGAVRLRSTGMIGTGRAETAVVVRRGDMDVASLGMFSAGNVLVAPGGLIDAYSSGKGLYGAQLDHTGAALGSNGNITVSGTALRPTTVQGDVTPGPDGAVTTSGAVTISGATDKALEATVLPDVEVPPIALQGPQVQASPYPFVISAGEVGYESLTIQAGAQVIIQGPARVVLGSLSLAGAAQLSFDSSQGPIELFVKDALNLALNSVVTTSNVNPESVRIEVPNATAAAVNLKATGPFHGVIYAPKATVSVGKNFELFGALVADRLTLDNSVKLHFDRHLAELAAEAALPTQLSWRLEALANLSGDLATNPFDFLGLDANLLPVPNTAHADQTLSIDYYDFSNVYHRYVGLESTFDWTRVKTVLTATRDGVEVLFPTSTTLKTGTRKSPGVAPVIDGPMI